MPRRARHFASDSIFHAGARGVDRQPIFLTDAERRLFIDTMVSALKADDIATISYCLMPNHFHWELATRGNPFDKAFHETMTRHAMRFNRLHGRTGHLFEDRHWSKRCEDTRHIENAIAYIHLNPHRANLVRDPREWEWSSYREWSGEATGIVDFERAAELAGKSVEELLKSHEERVRSEIAGGPRGMDIEALIEDAASVFGISEESLKSGARGHAFTLAKLRLLDRCADENLSVDELAKALGCTREAIYMLRKRRN